MNFTIFRKYIKVRSQLSNYFKELETNRPAKSDRPLEAHSIKPILLSSTGRSGFSANVDWKEIPEEIFKYFLKSFQISNVYNMINGI